MSQRIAEITHIESDAAHRAFHHVTVKLHARVRSLSGLSDKVAADVAGVIVHCRITFRKVHDRGHGKNPTPAIKPKWGSVVSGDGQDPRAWLPKRRTP